MVDVTGNVSFVEVSSVASHAQQLHTLVAYNNSWIWRKLEIGEILTHGESFGVTALTNVEILGAAGE